MVKIIAADGIEFQSSLVIPGQVTSPCLSFLTDRVGIIILTSQSYFGLNGIISDGVTRSHRAQQIAVMAEGVQGATSFPVGVLIA